MPRSYAHLVPRDRVEEEQQFGVALRENDETLAHKAGMPVEVYRARRQIDEAFANSGACAVVTDKDGVVRQAGDPDRASEEAAFAQRAVEMGRLLDDGVAVTQGAEHTGRMTGRAVEKVTLKLNDTGADEFVTVYFDPANRPSMSEADALKFGLERMDNAYSKRRSPWPLYGVHRISKRSKAIAFCETGRSLPGSRGTVGLGPRDRGRQRMD